MTEELAARPDHDTRSNGRRWYDANRMVVALGGILMTILFALGCFALGAAVSAHAANSRQDAEIDALRKSVGEIKADVRDVSMKVDRVLDRLPK